MGRYPENTCIKDSILLGRTSESTPHFLRVGNEPCERVQAKKIITRDGMKEEETCLFLKEQQ